MLRRFKPAPKIDYSINERIGRLGVLVTVTALLLLVEYAYGDYDRWDGMTATLFGGFGIWWMVQAGIGGHFEAALVGLLVAGSGLVLGRAIVDWEEPVDGEGWLGIGLVLMGGLGAVIAHATGWRGWVSVARSEAEATDKTA